VRSAEYNSDFFMVSPWVGEEAGRQNIKVEVALVALLPKSFPQSVVNHDADPNDNHKTKKF
jgi:hypothetical protein